VLMTDSPLRVPEAIAHARFTRRLVGRNVTMATGREGGLSSSLAWPAWIHVGGVFARTWAWPCRDPETPRAPSRKAARKHRRHRPRRTGPGHGVGSHSDNPSQCTRGAKHGETRIHPKRVRAAQIRGRSAGGGAGPPGQHEGRAGEGAGYFSACPPPPSRREADFRLAQVVGGVGRSGCPRSR